MEAKRCCDRAAPGRGCHNLVRNFKIKIETVPQTCIFLLDLGSCIRTSPRLSKSAAKRCGCIADLRRPRATHTSKLKDCPGGLQVMNGKPTNAMKWRGKGTLKFSKGCP